MTTNLAKSSLSGGPVKVSRKPLPHSTCPRMLHLTPKSSSHTFDISAQTLFHGCGSSYGPICAWSGLNASPFDWPFDPFDMAARANLARSEDGQPRRDHLDGARCGGLAVQMRVG